MYEIKRGNSYWAPYLALCPSISEFSQPMFWNEEEREEELAGLSVLWDVQRDLYNIEREYQQFAVPFIEECLDIMRYAFIILRLLHIQGHLVGHLSQIRGCLYIVLLHSFCGLFWMNLFLL